MKTVGSFLVECHIPPYHTSLSMSFRFRRNLTLFTFPSASASFSFMEGRATLGLKELSYLPLEIVLLLR